MPARRFAARKWIVLAVVSFAAGGVCAALALRVHHRAARVQAALPAVPDMERMPSEFNEALARAHDEAISRVSVLDGVARLGRIYHANGFNAEAEACWRLLNNEQPHEAKWLYYLTDLPRISSDHTEMDRLLEATVARAPDYAPTWLRRAELRFKSGRFAEAAADYDKRLELLPGDPYARLGLARVAQQMERRDESRKLIEEIVNDVPGFSPAHNLYAEMLAAEGDTHGAHHERWLGRESGRFRDPEDPWLHELTAYCYDPERLFTMATIQFQTGEGDRGQGMMERALQLAPENPENFSRLGDLYLKLGEAAKARDVLERRLALTSGPPPSILDYANLSQAFRVLEKPDEAVRIARMGLARIPAAFELHDALGLALGDLGRNDEAITSLHEAVTRSPNDANANFNLAVFLLAENRINEARAFLERSLTTEPTFPKSLLLLCHLALDAGRVDEAVKHAQLLYDSHPEQEQSRKALAECHRRLGSAATAKGDLAAAERHFRAGVDADPDAADLQASLGVQLLVQGRFRDAVASLEAYHRLEPKIPQSSLFLGQAYARLGRTAEAQRILSEGALLAEQNGNADTASHCREILADLQRRARPGF